MKLTETIRFLERQAKLSKLRRYAKKFIPLEKIAKDPKMYGYNVQPRESKAQQEAFIASKSKICALILGNRAGKTEAGVKKALDVCYEHSGEFWVCSPSYDLQKSGVQKKIMEFLKEEDIAHVENLTRSIIKSIVINNAVGGKTIINFKTYEQGREKVQSADIIGALLDEEPPEDFYDEVYTRTLDHNGQMILTFTPLNGRTWTYDRIYNNSDVDKYSWGMIDNPFIDLHEIEKMKESMSFNTCRMRIYGEYVGSETAVYPMFRRDTHIKKGLYNPNQAVDITIDFGVVVASCIFGQHQIVIDNSKTTDRFVIIDAMEMRDVGYATMMTQILQRITEKNYIIGEWFCDPAGRGRGQHTRSGISLLSVIKEEFGITFRYIKQLGIEESIDIITSYMINANGEAKFFLNGDINVDDKETKLASRIEGYVRDKETHKPIDDEVVTHINDCIRYWVANKTRGAIRGDFAQG